MFVPSTNKPPPAADVFAAVFATIAVLERVENTAPTVAAKATDPVFLSLNVKPVLTVLSTYKSTTALAELPVVPFKFLIAAALSLV